MDGAFLDLESESIEAEVDEYWRELYKIQKVFNNKVKKMQAEKEERDRERKKRRRAQAMEEAGEDGEPKKEAKEEEDEKLHVPAALSVTNGVQEQIKEYRVSGAQIWNYRGMKITQTYIGLELYL